MKNLLTSEEFTSLNEQEENKKDRYKKIAAILGIATITLSAIITSIIYIRRKKKEINRILSHETNAVEKIKLKHQLELLSRKELATMGKLKPTEKKLLDDIERQKTNEKTLDAKKDHYKNIRKISKNL